MAGPLPCTGLHTTGRGPEYDHGSSAQCARLAVAEYRRVLAPRDGDIHVGSAARSVQERERRRPSCAGIRMDPAPTFAARTRLTNAQNLGVWLVLGRGSNLPTIWSNCIAGCWLGGWNPPAPLLAPFVGPALPHPRRRRANSRC